MPSLTVAEQRLVGRITGGDLVGLTAAQVKTLLAIANTDVSGLGTAATAATTDFDAAGAATTAQSNAETYAAGLVDDLSGVTNAATARTNLGLGTMATQSSSSYLPLVAAGASVENIGAVESNVETASVSTTKTADTSLYGVFDYTMTGNTTFTFSNPAPSGKATIFTLILRGAFTPTFPAAVTWGDGAAPTYTTPSQYVFTTVDAGTTWLGQEVAKAYA